MDFVSGSQRIIHIRDVRGGVPATNLQIVHPNSAVSYHHRHVKVMSMSMNKVRSKEYRTVGLVMDLFCNNLGVLKNGLRLFFISAHQVSSGNAIANQLRVAFV